MLELISSSLEVRIALYGIFLSFMFMWYKGKMPTTGELQDFATILNSRGGNILILSLASIYFFHRSESMYYIVVQMIKSGTITADNGIALNGLTFDTGAFGAAFGALLKTMQPDSISPPSSTSSGSTTTTRTIEHHAGNSPIDTPPTTVDKVVQTVEPTPVSKPNIKLTYTPTSEKPKEFDASTDNLL
jgi:hypothetical protein